MHTVSPSCLRRALRQCSVRPAPKRAADGISRRMTHRFNAQASWTPSDCRAAMSQVLKDREAAQESWTQMRAKNADADRLLEEMVSAGAAVSDATVRVMLVARSLAPSDRDPWAAERLCERVAAIAAASLNPQLLAPSPETLGLRIEAVAGTKEPHREQDSRVAAILKDVGPEPYPRPVYNALILLYLRRMDRRKVMEVRKQMQKAGVDANRRTHELTLGVALTLEELDNVVKEATRAFPPRKRRVPGEKPPNRRIYQRAMMVCRLLVDKGMAKHGQALATKGMQQAMRYFALAEPQCVRCCNELILCAHTVEHLNRSLALVAEVFRKEGVAPVGYTYTSIIKRAGELGQIEMADAAHARARSTGVWNSHVAYTFYGALAHHAKQRPDAAAYVTAKANEVQNTLQAQNKWTATAERLHATCLLATSTPPS